MTAGAPTVSVSQCRLGADEDDGRAVREELNPHICHPECSISGFQVLCACFIEYEGELDL